jgi:GNAT superfamily N-acetyltransferase
MAHWEFEVRPATSSDAEAIAAAHLDSIRSIGAQFYTPEIVDDWAARVSAGLYVRAMGLGESFFLAIGKAEGRPLVLGFSTHKIVGAQHRTAVYVRSGAVRSGVGTALFKRAEADAIESGAGAIDVDASLAASDFYKANGFHEIGRGEHQLWSGRRMACIFMRKHLSTSNHSV